MEISLDQNQTTFNVIIGNTMMKFPIYPIINFCPNLTHEIFNEKTIILDSSFDLNGVRDFFEGISKNALKITILNCDALSKLSLMSGSEEIYSKVTKFINENQKSIPDVMNEVINDEPRNNNEYDEIDKKNNLLFMAQHYNELLKYPELLKNIKITQHYNILQMALNHYDKKNFDIHGLISFVINLLKNEKNQDYSVLLTLFDPVEFTFSEIEQLASCSNFDKSCLNFPTIEFLKTMKEQEEKIKYLEMQVQQFDSTLKNYINELIQQIQQILSEQNSKMQALIEKQQEQTAKKCDRMKSIIENNQVTVMETLLTLYEQNKKILDDQNSKLQAMCMQQQSFDEQNKNQFDKQRKLIEDNQKIIINQMKMQHGDMKTLNESNQKIIINQMKMQHGDMKTLNESNQKIIINQMKMQHGDMKTLIENNQKSMKDENIQQEEKYKKIFNDQIISNQHIYNQIKNKYNEIKVQIENIQKFNNEIIIKKIDELKVNIEDKQIKVIHNKLKSIKTDTYNIKQFIPISFDCTTEHGIFKSYYHALFDSPFKDGMIEISGNSDVGYSKVDLENITKNSYLGWKSSDDINSNITIDFKKRKFRFKGVSLSNCYSGNCFIRGFKIEGKTDFDSEWKLLSNCNMEDILTSAGKTGIHWNHQNSYYRYIRLKMTTPNAAGNHIIELKNLDLFGTLK